MTQKSASDGPGGERPQPRAKPLQAKFLEETSSAVQPIEEPTRPGQGPPAPIPVAGYGAGEVPGHAPTAAPVPPAPIPVQGPWGQPAPPAPIPVQAQAYPPGPAIAVPIDSQSGQPYPPLAIPAQGQGAAPPSGAPAWPQPGGTQPPAAPVPVETQPEHAAPRAEPAPAKPPSPPASPAGEAAPEPPASAPPGQRSAAPAAASAAAKARPVALSEAQQKRRAEQGPVSTKKWEKGDKPTGVREELEEREEEGAPGSLWREFLENNQSWLISTAVHALLLVVLGFWMVHSAGQEVRVVASTDPPEEIVDLPEDLELDEPLDPVEVPPSDVIDRPVDMRPLEPEIDHMPAAEGINAASMDTIAFNPDDVIPLNRLLSELGQGTGHLDQPGTGRGEKGFGFGAGGTGRGLGGRGSRRTDATKLGATPESEKAVNLALKWLADHQFPDGGWSFKHHLCPHCQGKCPNPGEIEESRIGATAFGVLPFLSAGQTHQVGDYQQTVASGLNFLIARMVIRPGKGGDLRDTGGRMYSHGLAALALCEAYAMSISPNDAKRMENVYRGSDDNKEGERVKGPVSNDGHSSPSQQKQEDLGPKQPAANITARDIAALKAAAQAALNFIAYAQDPAQGGWRYQPRIPGDTSVVGWQLMAVTSGRMAGLVVHPATVLGGSRFLDFVQRDDYGSDYGYTDKSRGTNATRSIGLLCRMYLGWAKDHPGIEQGVQAISDMGPSHGNMYYNYYATQVMHHYGGELWKRWNNVMRDQLVNSQAKAGCPAGSWFFGGGGHGSQRGGRLYCTSMAAMTLEVYYRHMPLYRDDIFKIEEKEQKQQQAKDNFPELK